MSNMVINTNILALNSHRAMKNVGAVQAQASARLSSGLRINSAADDAAGLAISEKMRAQIRGLDMASKNAQDGSSLVQTAEGGMQQIDNMIQRMRELAVQSANDTNEDEDRKKIQLEVNNLLEEIGNMSERVQFNKKVLLNGSILMISLQVGANSGTAGGLAPDGSANVINFSIAPLNLSGLSLTGLKIDTHSDATAAISTLDSALGIVTSERAKLGAIQNRLEYTMKSLGISSENLSASESRIRDADMAKEMMTLTKTNVLSQAATSMLAQANQAPQNILTLLR